MRKLYLALFFSILWTSTVLATEEIGGINYELNENKHTAKVVSGSYSGSIVIPETVKFKKEDYRVTEIGEGAFCGGKTSLYGSVGAPILSIEIPNSVINIGSFAFCKCINLTSINIPSSVLRIEQCAFAGCTSLSSIILNEGLTYIGTDAFAICTHLNKITIPSSLTSMGSTVFYHCTSIKNIVWNAKHCADFNGTTDSPFSCYSTFDLATYLSVDHFHRSFNGDKDMYRNIWTTSITFGDEVEHIPAYLCSNFQSELRNVVIPDNVKTIGDGAFSGCLNLISVQFGNGLTEIGKDAFSGTAINTLVIPDNVTSINQGAFSGCPLKTLTIGKSVVSIGSQAFSIYGQYPKLISIMSYALVPPPIDNSVFAYMVDDNELEEKLEKINLYVREKAFDAYNASEVWKEMNIDYFPNDIRTYSLTVNSADKSMGATSPNGEYDEEEEVVISALPKAGYQFDHWNDGSKDNPRTIKVTGNLTYTAYFAPATPKYKYTLAVSASNPLEGAAIGGGVFESGAQATLAAVANTGYHFTQWADGNTDNPRIVTVVADATYIANFAQDPVAPTLYELNIAPENAAQGWTTEGCAYESGAQVMIYAHPAEGYQFEQWSDSNKDNPRFLTMTEEVNLTAKFVEKTTTGVSAANSSDTSAQKIVRDGQVYVLRGDKLYTLQGQEVK